MSEKLYRSLAATLRDEFRSGALRDGDPLPSEARLQEDYAVSRTTVRRALALLEEEGLLERRKGVGAFYRTGRIAKRLSRELDFHAEGRAHGRAPATRVLALSLREPSLSERAVFGPEARRGVMELRRLRLLDGAPSVLQSSVLCHPGLETLGRAELENVSLYRLLDQRFGLRVSRIEETLEAVAAGEETARLLGLAPGAPVFGANRIGRDDARRVVEISHNFVRADRYYFAFDGVVAEYAQ